MERQERRGFSLVEILVVIAIVMAVTGLGFYVFRAGQEAADKISGDSAKAIDTVKNRKWGQKAPRTMPIKGEYLVSFKPGVNIYGAVDRLRRLLPMTVVQMMSSPGGSILYAKMEAQYAKAISQDAAVLFVEQNKLMPLCQCTTCNTSTLASCQFTDANLTFLGVDTSYNGTAGINTNLINNNPGTPANVQPQIPYLWSGVGVALLDSGVDTSHPDISGGVASTTTTTTGSTINYQSSVFPAPNDGTWTSPNGTDDRANHGTGMAGIISALNNNIGVAGVTPGIRIISYKITTGTSLGTVSVGSAGNQFVGFDYAKTSDLVAACNSIINIYAPGKSNDFTKLLGNIHVAVIGINVYDFYTDYDGPVNDIFGNTYVYPNGNTGNFTTIRNKVAELVTTGVTVVVPAGNGGATTNPASTVFGQPNPWGTGAMTALHLNSSRTGIAGSSNRPSSATFNAIAAPGSSLCVLQDTVFNTAKYQSSVSGSSYAAAYVGGASARFIHSTVASRFPRNITFNRPSHLGGANDTWAQGSLPAPTEVVRILRTVLNNGTVSASGNVYPVLSMANY